MTLRFKLCEPFDGLRTETANQLEQIADEYAIGFADWFKEQTNNQPKGFDRKSLVYKTTAELLEIYKKERSL